MSFSTLMQRAQRQQARVFSSATAAIAGAWFPATANGAPSTRSAFTVAVNDVTPGAPRITRDALSGMVNTPVGTVRVAFATAALAYVPVANDTVCLAGATRATATMYRVAAVETLAGIYELELREEAQYLAP